VSTVPRPSRPDPVRDTTEMIAAIKSRAAQDINRHQRFIERFTVACGRPGTIYVLLIVSAVWILYNTIGVRLGAPQIDQPPFFWLQGAQGFFGAVVALSVLATQNRQSAHQEQRDHLELEVNLLTEQKAAKIIQLLEELRMDLPTVRNRVDREADAMMGAVDPHEVLEALDDTRDDRSTLTRTSRERSAG
jgi:uncharacterized membrane protein